jgi:glutathione synthase/RimK-type ligase-like ATP-grasp enzyme
MRRAHIGLATSARGLEFDQDLDPTLGALAEHGFQASAGCWDDPTVDWAHFDLVVVRSTWDYAERRGEFLRWARSIERLANPADILAWNTDKHYLADLAAAGVPTVPTLWIDQASDFDFEFPEGDLVVKPTVGAGGTGAARFGPDERLRAFGHANALLDRGVTAMVQPYLSGIERDGERGLIYLGHRFSHAIYKPPLLGQRGPFAAGSLTVDIIEPTQPTDGELEFAAAVLDATPGSDDRLLYARVDVAPGDDGSPLLIELEVTEPNLYFNCAEGAAARLANAVEGWLARI